jgi:hypothetical protein
MQPQLLPVPSGEGHGPTSCRTLPPGEHAHRPRVAPSVPTVGVAQLVLCSPGVYAKQFMSPLDVPKIVVLLCTDLVLERYLLTASRKLLAAASFAVFSVSLYILGAGGAILLSTPSRHVVPNRFFSVTSTVVVVGCLACYILAASIALVDRLCLSLHSLTRAGHRDMRLKGTRLRRSLPLPQTDTPTKPI